ncbi:MAG: hypothetical protein KDH17_05365 [Rhodocyclaceae bacterium]|nr:hypothetical protein [Rhodocyclaceae bacterium]
MSKTTRVLNAAGRGLGKLAVGSLRAVAWLVPVMLEEGSRTRNDERTNVLGFDSSNKGFEDVFKGPEPGKPDYVVDMAYGDPYNHWTDIHPKS